MCFQRIEEKTFTEMSQVQVSACEGKGKQIPFPGFNPDQQRRTG